MTERKCAGMKSDGSPCGAPANLIGEDGFCDAHRPGGREELRERGRRGGYVSTSPRKADVDLPELRAPEDVAIASERIAQAVADGSLSASKANALRRLLQTWMEAHETVEANEAKRRAHEGEVFGPRA